MAPLLAESNGPGLSHTPKVLTPPRIAVLFQAIHDVICTRVGFILGQTLPKAAQGVSYGEAKRVTSGPDWPRRT
jgi:hypothetical protein